ncbi:MAG: porin family protein [Holosporaceae bacterium]|jgi:hypothetical protein|nr:porin family protein [Holosporaceae bacterium]
MKISFVSSAFLILLASGVCAAGTDVSTEDSNVEKDVAVANSETAEDFIALAEPEKVVSGAYLGAGFALSMISHKINVLKTGASNVAFKNSANQYDIYFIGGFGSAFYARYYAGIEMAFFQRLAGSTKYAPGERIGLRHSSGFGLDMDVRLGYQFPQSGNLVYATVGFARVIGKAVLDVSGTGHNGIEVPFGSFYPTFGCGFEHKINYYWNIRGDLRISITAKDDYNKKFVNGMDRWPFDAKPSKFSIRVSITRSI